MKKSLVAVAIAFGFALSAIGPISHGPWPIPDDGNGGNIVAHGPWPIPDDGNGGNIVAHGPWPIPDDGNGGNIVA